MIGWHQELLKQCGEQWEAAMAGTDNFCAEIRPKDAVDAHEELNVAAFNASMGSSTVRVEKTLSCIAARGWLQNNMTALDIGSGNGVFTIPFSEHYQSVTSLDISTAMQDEIRRRVAERGIGNISYVNANWRTLDLEEQGLKNAFDLVLCSINPRGVCSLDTLRKMNDASRGGCCLLAFAGRGRSNHGGELQRLILGRNLGTKGGNDIIFPFNAAYHMGGEPDLAYTSVGWERRLQPEEAVESICFAYWRFAEITPEIREKIKRYVFEHLEEGYYVDRTESLIGITVWDAWRIKEKDPA